MKNQKPVEDTMALMVASLSDAHQAVDAAQRQLDFLVEGFYGAGRIDNNYYNVQYIDDRDSHWEITFVHLEDAYDTSTRQSCTYSIPKQILEGLSNDHERVDAIVNYYVGLDKAAAQAKRAREQDQVQQTINRLERELEMVRARLSSVGI